MGGFIGAVSRYYLSGLAQKYFHNYNHLGTLAVNILGCFLLGVFMHLVHTRGLFGPNLRLMVSIGLIGALTTYSTFAFETYQLMVQNRVYAAGINIMFHLTVGLAAVWAAIALSQNVIK